MTDRFTMIWRQFGAKKCARPKLEYYQMTVWSPFRRADPAVWNGIYIQGVHFRCIQALGFTQKKVNKISSWNFILGLFYTLIQGSWGFRSSSTPGSVFLASKLPEGIFCWSWDFAKMFFGCFKCQFQSFMMIGWVLDYQILTKKWLVRLKNGSKLTFLSLTSHFFVKIW